MKMKIVFALNTALILLLASCSALNPTPAATQTPEVTQVPPTTGTQYHFVTNKLLIPTTQAQSQAYALNLDGNSQNHNQNLFGGLLALLTTVAPGVDLQSTVDQAVNAGQVISLHVVKTNDLQNAPSVSWSIFQGQKTQSPPKFDGSDQFMIDPAGPASSPIVGSLTNGHFTGGPGTTQVTLYLLGTPVVVSLIGVRLDSDLSAKGCTNGKLGGGVTVDEFRSKLLPGIVAGLNGIISTDKTVATPILQALDSDHNGTISIQELENNPLLIAALSPDLDLLDASGKFNPGQDGVKDSYSMGLGFTCVLATFTAPGD